MIPLLLTQQEFNFIKESNEIESEKGVDFDHLNAFMDLKLRELSYDGVNKAKIDESFVLDLHGTLMARKLVHFAGKYRETPVGIYKGYELIKQMPNPSVVPALMDNWIEEFNKMEMTPWDLHKSFENIHPFIDGNGRTGRLLWAYDLLRRGAEIHPMLDDFRHPSLKNDNYTPNTFDEKRQRYYEALN